MFKTAKWHSILLVRISNKDRGIAIWKSDMEIWGYYHTVSIFFNLGISPFCQRCIESKACIHTSFKYHMYFLPKTERLNCTSNANRYTHISNTQKVGRTEHKGKSSALLEETTYAYFLSFIIQSSPRNKT
jgi:hypothetical protein